MIYNILVCDDEKLQRKVLIDKIEMYFSNQKDKYKIFQASNGKEALKINRDKNIHVAFLDIELEDIKGIELSKKLKDVNDSLLIIFVTGYPDYMMEAFNQFAFNYILKPIKQVKFQAVLVKALEEIKKINKRNNKKFYNIVCKNKINSIPYSDIIYFEKKINNLIIVLEKEHIEIRNTLKNVEKAIDMEYFIRCHRSIIINKKRVIKLIGNNITLKGCDVKIPIGGKYKNNVLREISKMIRERQYNGL